MPSIFGRALTRKYLRMRFLGEVEYADYASNAHKVPTMAADPERIATPTQHWSPEHYGTGRRRSGLRG
ncbi:MAG: hypothetical protein RQ753_08945 [Desulfurivibrionaceae bacterium]|nr:hypothetical protein [Desulfobulbales bacterium]MDT8335814.1 hypothetical protein [Desulfurivibrionaceae bacterium]